MTAADLSLTLTRAWVQLCHGRTDADRNCISNIHPPEGLGYREAARVAAGLLAGAVELGRSGVDLKDTSRSAALGPLSVVELT